MKATAIANPNIALVKYWGKRNKELILPYNSSISMTISNLFTKTTVEFSKEYEKDSLIIDDQVIEGEELEKVVNHLDLVREKSGLKERARVVSKNNFPKAAGLASSASGFAALTMAAVKASGLQLSEKELSILARRGSGSASRSILGGYVEWLKGSKEDGLDSYAKQIAPQGHWPELYMIVTIVKQSEKKIKSRAGMSKTVETSPLYKAWLETIEEDLEKVRRAILEKNFTLLGKTAEMNALKMHCTMLTTEPHIIYWEPETIVLMKKVMDLRDNGVECYFTIDGGPQVKILCLKENKEKIVNELKKCEVIKDIIVCQEGFGTKTSEDHLF